MCQPPWKAVCTFTLTESVLRLLVFVDPFIMKLGVFLCIFKKNTTQIANVSESQMFLFYFESMLIERGKGRCYTDSSPMDGNIYEDSPSPSPSPSWKTYFRQCILKSGFCQPLLWREHNRLLWKAQAQLELERMRLVGLQGSVRPPALSPYEEGDS